MPLNKKSFAPLLPNKKIKNKFHKKHKSFPKKNKVFTPKNQKFCQKKENRPYSREDKFGEATWSLLIKIYHRYYDIYG